MVHRNIPMLSSSIVAMDCSSGRIIWIELNGNGSTLCRANSQNESYLTYTTMPG